MKEILYRNEHRLDKKRMFVYETNQNECDADTEYADKDDRQTP